MKVLVINPIMYTSETKNIKRAASIKDTMMYDFCLAFHEMGHSVTLVGGEPFKPTKSETYPFEVLWWECKCQKVCMPHCLPFMPETYWYVKQHRTEYDLIITSEVFSLNSLMAYRAAPDKTIIWHELAKHYEENSLKNLVWSYSKTLHAKCKGCCTLSRGKKLCEEILHEYGCKCNRSRCQPR